MKHILKAAAERLVKANEQPEPMHPVKDDITPKFNEIPLPDGEVKIEHAKSKELAVRFPGKPGEPRYEAAKKAYKAQLRAEEKKKTAKASTAADVDSNDPKGDGSEDTTIEGVDTQPGISIPEGMAPILDQAQARLAKAKKVTAAPKSTDMGGPDEAFGPEEINELNRLMAPYGLKEKTKLSKGMRLRTLEFYNSNSTVLVEVDMMDVSNPATINVAYWWDQWTLGGEIDRITPKSLKRISEIIASLDNMKQAILAAPAFVKRVAADAQKKRVQEMRTRK